jgi:hypothetical protein
MHHSVAENERCEHMRRTEPLRRKISGTDQGVGRDNPQHNYTGEKLLYIAKMSQGRWKRNSKGVFRKEIQENGKY